jgi:spore germination protein YaaH
VVPTVRAAAQKDIEAANTILGSPGLRDAHINALVQLSQQSTYSGIDIDYRGLNPARKGDFSSFITVLGDRLHQSNRTLTVTLPMPVKSGVNWDTGAYDWEELGRRADVIKLVGEQDPSIYHQRMEEALNFLKPKLTLNKVVLVVTRQSVEKGSDGLRTLSLGEGLTLASTIEVRTTSQITPNSSVVIVGKNIFQDDGASGLRWDDTAFAVAFSYPGRGGQRTVWLENSLSLAFKLDLARRFGLGGVSIDDVSLNQQAPAFWTPLRLYAESGNVALAQPNGVLLRPAWQIQAGGSEPGTKGNIVWKAPAQPGAYDVSLIISDGVIRAMQKIVLEVRPAAAAASPGGAPAPTVTPAVRQ